MRSRFLQLLICMAFCDTVCVQATLICTAGTKNKSPDKYNQLTVDQMNFADEITPTSVTTWCGGLNCGYGCSSSTVSSGPALSGTITDSYQYYKNSANCWWILSAPPGVEIRFAFLSMDTEEGKDIVRVYQCSSDSSPKE